MSREQEIKELVVEVIRKNQYKLPTTQVGPESSYVNVILAEIVRLS